MSNALSGRMLWTDERRELLMSLWQKPMSQVEIAAELGTGPDMVRKYAAKLGLPLRKFTHDSVWSAEQTAMLRKLWGEELSCAAIAQRIWGGFTKNSIIGKARRIGLPQRQTGRYGAGKGRGPRALYKPKVSVPRKRKDIFLTMKPRPAPAPVPVPNEEGAKPLMFTLMQLTNHTCKYPLGEATGARQLYCGAPKSFEVSYCRHHMRIAYRPLEPRSVRDAARQMARLAA